MTELAAPFTISLPAISKHLDVLEEAGLLVREKEGRIHRCRLVASTIDDAARWIARYRPLWERHFDSLAHHLSKPKEKDT